MSATARAENGATYANHMQELEDLLPGVLADLGKITNNKELVNLSADLERYIELVHSKLKPQPKKAAPKQKEPKNSNATQNQSQVDSILNHVFSRLDKKVAAEIRAEISRKDNKMLALQAALTARGIEL